MKKIILLIISVFIISCSKNDEPAETSNSVVGKWQITSIVEYGVPLNNYSCNTSFEVTEFLSNKAIIIKYADLNANRVCTQFTENGTYTLEGNILEIIQKNSNNVVIYRSMSKIVELSSAKLKLNTILLFESNGSSSHTTNYNDGEDVITYNKL